MGAETDVSATDCSAVVRRVRGLYRREEVGTLTSTNAQVVSNIDNETLGVEDGGENAYHFTY